MPYRLCRGPVIDLLVQAMDGNIMRCFAVSYTDQLTRRCNVLLVPYHLESHMQRHSDI